MDSRDVDIVGFPCWTNIDDFITGSRETTQLSYSDGIVMRYYFVAISRKSLAPGWVIE
jgi:hypothetical protein